LRLSTLVCAFAGNTPNLRNISRKGAKVDFKSTQRNFKLGHYLRLPTLVGLLLDEKEPN
jgi:hypothetical protein